MNNALKITLISFTSLIVIVLISVFVLIWIVFTPSKLTPIVRQQANKYITCKYEIGKVELTFFSTFPEFGIKINNLTFINPMNGAPSDTILNSDVTTATIDLTTLWKKNILILHGIKLEEVKLNAFVDKMGKANYDVYKSTSKDTSAFKNPFSQIDLQELSLRNATINYVNIASKMKANLIHLNGKLSLKMKGNEMNAILGADSKDVSFYRDSIDYLKHTNVILSIPFQFDTDKKLFTTNNSKIVLNGLIAHFQGTMGKNLSNDNINTDFKFTTENYKIKPILEMIPPNYASSIEGMNIDGFASTKGTIAGIYNDKLMPLFDININFDNGTFDYSGFSYKLREISGNVDVHVDMNREIESKVILNNVFAKTGQSEIEGKGNVDYILADDMFFDLDLKMKLNLPELDPMMPDGMNIKLDGFASGTAKAQFMKSDAMNKKFEKMKISGKFDADNLSIIYDSLSMSAPKAKLDLTMPNKKSNSNQFMDAGLWCNILNVQKGKNTSAKLYNVNLLAQTSDIRNTDRMNSMNCNFDFDLMSASMDNKSVQLEKTKGTAFMKGNMSDTVSIPEVKCKFDVQSLTASMDTTTAKISFPKGEFTMHGDKIHPEKAIFNINYTSDATFATMNSKSFNSKQMVVNANIIHNPKESNKMLQWIPTGTISMNQGKINIDKVKTNIDIPAIQFDFTPDEFVINKGQINIDRSDFKLTGKLSNISNYLNDKGLLKGDLNFISNRTDVYKIMDLTNGFNVEDSTAKNEVATKKESTSGPYMVPKGVDIKLHAQINEVLLGFDTAHNVIGDLVLNDGLLILQDMRFTTSAAKMQLTAMYKTPRKNHLFVGLDFHMTDMEISELLKMVPDIDSIMPMLKSFGGKGEFHIAVETYLDSTYHLKKSTLRGVSSIKGENLVLMDGETFSEIAKTLRFNKHTVNKVDSLSAEFTIFKNEVDIYPFLIVMDKYKAVVAGRHNLDMSFDYHISVTDSPLPFRLGVNVTGKIGAMKIRLAKCKYANLYRPAQRKEIDTKQLEIRQMIRDALTKEVIK
jgi:hypothetical protein